ncbi:hypothetical protein M514_24472 [Trichuris suis]|uniref:Uncharacterized protein n=1 Tax=Trichuris suis TaxID=68888 RepID=A0A085N1E6_9BILA|nr:hypothetical protein M514_24720 [Trichuris suis]KFD63292.1 hypothetical protein M514_24472 [Trichuris suis]
MQMVGIVANAREQRIELHISCDASESAYGAAVYLGLIESERANVSLTIAKSGIAPLKRVPIPRLEELIMDGNNKGASWSQGVVCEGLESLMNLKTLSMCGNKRLKGECMLNMRLENVETLYLMNWEVSEQS